MYSKKYYIETSDVDPFCELKLSSLFRIMQDTATDGVEEIGTGKAMTIDKGMFWVITRYSVDIIRNPRYQERIIVKTYPGDDMKFIFPRYFQIESESGEVLVKASSTWVVLDKINHKIVLRPFPGVNVPHEHLVDEEKLPRKVEALNLLKVMDRKVCYSDTDLNGHLNNTKYIDYIIDIHSKDFYSKNKIKHFIINYDHEIQADETVSLSIEKNGDNEIINGKADGVSAFSASIDYLPR